VKFGLKEGFLKKDYMLNSAELMTELGFSARVLEERFNTKNKYERTSPFHRESINEVECPRKNAAIYY
jgi:hypothetical protein